MTSLLENLKPHNRLLTFPELSRQFKPRKRRPNLIRNPAVKFDF